MNGFLSDVWELAKDPSFMWAAIQELSDFRLRQASIRVQFQSVSRTTEMVGNTMADKNSLNRSLLLVHKLLHILKILLVVLW